MTWRPGVLQDESVSVDDVAGGAPPSAVLGVAEVASAEEVELTADRIMEFLATAPKDIDGWASRQRAAVEQAAGQHAVEAATGDHRDAPSEPPADQPATRPTKRRIPRLLIVALLVPLVIWGVYKMGGAPSAGTESAAGGIPVAAASTPLPLDTAKVAELEAKVTADPADIEPMRELARLHLFAGDLETSARWQQRILADHPDDIDARLALGVALFNQGNLDSAEEQWLRAVELDPTAPEPHYNLGFLYVASDPPRMDEAKEHWDTVVDLAPDSDMAKNIATHMGAVVDSDTPTGSPTGEP